MLRKNLIRAPLSHRKSQNMNKHGTLTVLSSLLKRRRSIGDLIELFLWVLLVGIASYYFVSQIVNDYFSVLNSNSNPVKSESENDEQKSIASAQLSIQLTLQLQETNSGGGRENDTIKMLNLATDVFDTRFVVPNSLQFRRTPRSNSSSKNVVKPYSQQMLIFVCIAPFPIEFKYVGFGYPNFKVSIEKRVTSESYVVSVVHVLTLSFKNDLPQELETGRYICQAVRSIKNDEAFDQFESGYADKTPKYIDLYVPGEMKLLHESLQNLDDLLDGQADYDISSGLSRINRASEVIALHHDTAVDGKEIILPCGVSDPENKLSLFLKDSSGFESHLNEAIASRSPISYDFAVGFKVPVFIVKNMMKRFRGTNFICRSNLEDGVREFRFRIYLTDASNSQLTPDTREVLVTPGKLSVKKFVCESDEPVMIKWLDGHPASTKTEAVTLPNSTTLYRVSFIATPSQIPAGATMARFQCIRSQDDIIIHTWKWIRNGVSKPFLKKKDKKLSCCMNTTTTAAAAAGSLDAPQLLVKTCSTMVECHVKASFQPKIASAGRGIAEEEAKSHASCIAWTVPNDFHAGLIMCNGINRKSFQEKDENYHDDSTRSEEMPPVIVKWNDDVVIIKNKGMDANLSLLKRLTSVRILEETQNENAVHSSSSSPSYIKIECIASSMLFAKGFRWTLTTKSGKIIENIQRETTWEGVRDIILYNETYEQRLFRIKGILQIRRKEYSKPLLSIQAENSTQKGQGFAKLRMTDNIGIVKCEVPLWNDSDIWIPSFTDVHF